MYFSQEQIRELKKIDLLTYLQNYEPNELVHISGNNYCTRTHDSLKISNGLWNWFSKGIGGKNAIDYLIKVKNYTFIEALQLLANCNIKNISFSPFLFCFFYLFMVLLFFFNIFVGWVNYDYFVVFLLI